MASFDLGLFAAPAAAGGFYAQTVQSASIPSRRISGIEKLGQRFIIELMTEIGSLSYLPQRGCDFVTAVRRGYVLSEFDLYATFAAAVLQASTNLQAEDRESDPDDEKLAGAQLASVTVGPDAVRLGVSVVGLAGTTVRLQVPLVFDVTSAGSRYIPD